VALGASINLQSTLANRNTTLLCFMQSPPNGKSQPSNGKVGIKAKVLGDFILIKNMIGKGSFAEVFEGFQKNTNIPVAIKVITRSKLNEKLMGSLEQEINIMRKIEHPNIIKLHAVHVSNIVNF
jgi:serine/threonine-protein kinase ULK/ATG1